VNKPYDGTNTASVTLSDDRLTGDDITTAYTSASFASVNVGTWSVSVSGINISGGADAGNYALGNTTATTTASITIIGQTITVNTSAPSAASNGTNFNVAATASSSLPVTITTSGACSGGDTDGTATITMTSGTGVCSVFYNQAGDTNYSAATQIQEDTNATQGPTITSAASTTFDVSLAGTFTITTSGNPSTPMAISQTGTLPSTISFVDNGDGTATLAGTPATGTEGIYSLVLTAGNGVAPDATQNFTLTIKNGPSIAIVGSSPDTGNGSIGENEVIPGTLNLTQITVQFSQDVNNPAGDTDIKDVTNPSNYLLVRGSSSSVFQTVSCSGGVIAPDFQIAVNSASYSDGGGAGPFVVTLGINGGLPLNVDGFYRLYVCGTTSIVDAVNTNLVLAGNGTTPGTDFLRTFRIQAPASGGGGNNGGSNNSNNTPSLGGVVIPVTGFAPNQVTQLPAKTLENVYMPGDMRLEIPSLNINVPIVGVKLNEKGWDVSQLGNNSGYLEGSAYPTWAGNTVLTGHVTDVNGKPGPFAYINELKTGDRFYIHNNGFTYVYEVRESQRILPISIHTLFKHEEYDWVTLVTCEKYDEVMGEFIYRRLVRAALISIITDN
jgi:LPXTG-site transpeptidase (sortase) family protein